MKKELFLKTELQRIVNNCNSYGITFDDNIQQLMIEHLSVVYDEGFMKGYEKGYGF